MIVVLCMHSVRRLPNSLVSALISDWKLHTGSERRLNSSLHLNRRGRETTKTNWTQRIDRAGRPVQTAPLHGSPTQQRSELYRFAIYEFHPYLIPKDHLANS